MMWKEHGGKRILRAFDAFGTPVLTAYLVYRLVHRSGSLISDRSDDRVSPASPLHMSIKGATELKLSAHTHTKEKAYQFVYYVQILQSTSYLCIPEK